MNEKRFDILPVIGHDFQISEYLCKGDKGEIIQKKIKDTIHYRTPILGCLATLVETNTNHIFLHNDSHKVVGLLSSSDFNCRGFATLVFSISTALENALADFLREEVANGYTIILKNKAKEQYADLVRRNLDVDEIECLSLSQLMNHIAKFRTKMSEIGFPQTRKPYKEMTGSIIKIRDDISHYGVKVHSIIGAQRSLNKLHLTLVKMRDLTIKLASRIGSEEE
jgi:hypothetical protein